MTATRNHPGKILYLHPINERLVETLISNGFEVTDSKVGDFHFHEVFFRLKGENVNVIKDIDIYNIILIFGVQKYSELLLSVTD